MICRCGTLRDLIGRLLFLETKSLRRSHNQTSLVSSNFRKKWSLGLLSKYFSKTVLVHFVDALGKSLWNQKRHIETGISLKWFLTESNCFEVTNKRSPVEYVLWASVLLGKMVKKLASFVLVVVKNSCKAYSFQFGNERSIFWERVSNFLTKI